MELGPIPAFSGSSSAQELPADFQLSGVAEIRAMSRSGNGARKKSTHTQPDEDDEVTLAGETQTVEEPQPDVADGHINLFA